MLLYSIKKRIHFMFRCILFLYLFIFIVNNINGDIMNKKIITISTLLLSILLISLLVVRTTYSLIVNVTSKDGKTELIDKITIRDIITDEYGAYNNYYYNVVTELNITVDEANILIESNKLNSVLNRVLNNVIDYRFNNGKRLSNDEIINIITEAVNNDSIINNELKEKVINKTNEYIYDITDYLYNIDTNIIGNNK